MANILVIAAHPDDETLGCGAAMAQHIKNGDEVSVLILGTGLASRDKNGKVNVDELANLRNDAHRALAKLGVKEKNMNFLDFRDNRFDSHDLLDIVKAIENVVTEKKPQTVYTHHWGDMNIDHRITFNAVMTACRPMKNCSVLRVLCFEILSSTEWNAQTASTAFMPNLYVDVTGTINKKLAALAEYHGEMRAYPHPRSIKGAEHLARTRGLTIETEAAEAFVIARMIERTNGKQTGK